jgi:glucans biosynthesis protein
MDNPPNNPMQPEPPPLALAPRCLARTRSGKPCRSPAVKGNRRCRMHGGKGSGAPMGNRNAYKHGARSAATLDALATIRAIGRLLDELES